MDEMKSALEIALEKIEKMGEATEEERLGWKYVPLGEKLAALYLKEEAVIGAELEQYDEQARPYVIRGAEDVLLRNISLPATDAVKKTNRRAMEGIKALKTDTAGLENVFSKFRYIFEHYGEQGKQQKEQAYQSLKEDIRARVQQAMQQQMGTVSGANIDVERQPQFQQEWRKLERQIDAQYEAHLNEYKQEVRTIA